MPDDTLDLRMITVGEWKENCYLIVDPATRESLLIDPGAEAGRILDWLTGTSVRAILLTHAHGDHVGALAETRAALGVQVGLHPNENALAEKYKVAPDFALNDGDVVRLGAHEIRVAYTPGHTPGGVCLRFGSRALVGDTIFPGGPGHTNSATELDQILTALQLTVFTWPDDTRLYPGHGQETTVGRERPGFDAYMARPRSPDAHGDVSW